MTNLGLDGRVALVTGGASGIGAATVRRLSEEGTSVAVVDRDGAAAKEVTVGDFDGVIGVSLRGVFLGLRAAFRQDRAHGGGGATSLNPARPSGLMVGGG